MIAVRRGRHSDVAGRPRRPAGRTGLLAALAALAALLGGCSAATGSAGSAGAALDGSSTTPPPVGSSAQTITVEGVARTFRLYRPASLPPTGPVPLVVMIHGGGGSAAGAERDYGWDAEADAQHFVVAYPDGLDRGWSVGGGCCRRGGSPTTDDTTTTTDNATTHDAATDDDVDFIGRLVTAVSHRLPIDPARIYATGISEGGMMSYRLACRTSLFAAVGPDSATLLGACPSPAPLSVIHIHGTADARIPYAGGPGAGVHHIDGPGAPALDATWRATDHCAAPAVATAGAVTTSVAGCPAGRAVELITIAGAGHQWPGKACNARCARGRADPPSTALDATDTIWRFFAAHPESTPR